MKKLLILGSVVLAVAACGNSEQTRPAMKKAKADPVVASVNPRASGVMPCSMRRPSYNRNCAYVVNRRSQADATLQITKPNGQVRVLQFQRGEFTSGRAKLQYRKDGDFWLVNVNDREFYRFSNAVFTGG